MRPPVRPPIPRPLAATLVVVVALSAGSQVLVLARIIAARFSCPLDLEYLENAHVYHAWRLFHGMGLYGDPSRGFATFPYPPLYWVAMRASAAVVGYSDQAGRAVSIASLIGTAAVLAWQVIVTAPGRRLGLAMVALALGGLCAGYPFCGGSYDLTRADTMAMFLTVLAGAAAGDGLLSPARAWGTALLLTASIFTKQTGVMFALWLIVYAWSRNRRGAVYLASSLGLACGVTFGVLQAMTGGWFARWVFYPGRQPLFPDRTFDALAILLEHAPFLPLLVVCVVWLMKRRTLRPRTALWVGMLGAGIVSSVLAGIKDLAWLNVWMPGVLLAWPVGFMITSDALSPGWREGRARAEAIWVLGYGACLLAVCHYDPAPFVPSQDRWAAATRLDAIVRGLGGEVVVTTAPMVAVAAGTHVEQPILATYEDARNAGMNLDYVDALVASGARWVITTGRYTGDRAPETHLPRAFVRQQQFDFDVHSLAAWDHPTNVVLWRRSGL